VVIHTFGELTPKHYLEYVSIQDIMAAHHKLIEFIRELQRSIRTLGLALCLTTLLVFLLSPQLLQVAQAHLAEKLYFFSVSGPFLAHVKLSLFAAVYLLMPWFMTVFWRAIGKPFGVPKNQLFFFILFTCLLFYSGTLFCYFVTLPLGIDFLLGYGSEELKPVISVGRFANFFTIFILAFGLVFELPLYMVFFAKVGVFKRQFYERNRKYAVLLIAILSAMITPTPDIINLSMMAGPLYMLYESGILILRLLKLGK